MLRVKVLKIAVLVLVFLSWSLGNCFLSLFVTELGLSAKMSTTQATASGPLAAGSEHERPSTNDGYPSDAKDPRATVNDGSSDEVSEHAQHGVKQMEAVTVVWTKKSLGLAYAM